MKKMRFDQLPVNHPLVLKMKEQVELRVPKKRKMLQASVMTLLKQGEEPREDLEPL